MNESEKATMGCIFLISVIALITSIIGLVLAVISL